jgi:hypothetical protein
VLRRIFRPKRDEVTGGCRKLHNEELHNLYSSPSAIRMIKARRMNEWEEEEKKNAYRILLRKSEGMRPLGRSRSRWCGMELVDLAQDKDQWRAVVNTVMNLRIPQSVGKFSSG